MTISSLFNCAGKQIEPVDDASRPYQQRRAILPQRGTTDPLTAPSSLDETCPSTLPPLRRGSPNLDKQIALRSSRNLLSLSGTLRKSQSLIRSASLRISRTNVFLQSAASRLSIRSFREGRSGGKTDANSQYRLRYGSKLVPREKFRELKIFSREFNMTQDRSASSLRLTDNCNTCKLPVFLAERLKIGSKLFHRICFKCARCGAQLTPGNQYETENGEHCCEVCPDEEGSLTSSITSLSPNISSLKISEILDSDASVDKIQEEKSKRIERFPSSVQSLISRFDTQAARSAFFTNELRSRFEEMPPNAKEEKEDEINSVSEKAFDTIKENEQSVSTNGIPESQPKLENTTDISIIHQKHSHCNPFEEEEGQPSSVSGLCSSNMEDDVAEPSVINSSAVEKEDVVSELEIGNKSDVDSLHSEDVDLSAQDMHNVDLPFVAEVGDDVQTGSADKTPIENSDESEVVAVLPVASPRKRGKSKTKLAEYPESLNPFDDGLESEDQHMKLDDKAEGTNQEKGSLTLNPFEEEDEDFDDTNPFAEDVISVRKSPVPLPRKSLESSRESSYPYMRSPSPSLSVGSSISMTPTLRKRLTPISPMTDTSRPVSPASTIGRYRKVRRAPPPPIEKHPPMEKSPLPDLVKMNQSERNNISDPDIVSEEFRRPGHNKNEKDKLNENRKSSDSKKFELPSKDSYGQWKRKKGPAPPRPFPQKRQLRKLPMRQLQQELQDLEIQQSEMERQGVSLERQIRAITESNAISQENNSTESLKLEAEDLILQLFDIVNEKNELLRRQTELMYLKRQQRLEEEYVELEYQIRCLLDKPENSRTEEDKKREEELIQRLVLVVERRAEIVDCLELERRRGEEEDTSIKCHLEAYNLKHDSTPSSSPASESKQTKSKFKSPAKLLMKVSEHKKKHKQEGETQSEKKTKIKWFKK